jgi:hypothetical protein
VITCCPQHVETGRLANNSFHRLSIVSPPNIYPISMPLRPFPIPLRIGADICSIGRIRRLLRPGQQKVPPLHRFLPKLLTWPEQQYFWSRFNYTDVAHDSLNKIAQYLAGRYARPPIEPFVSTNRSKMGRQRGLSQGMRTPRRL